MAMDTNELVARARIEHVLIQYASALDARNWAGLEQVFSEDASVNYHGVGAFQGREAIVGVISGFLDRCGPTQHLLGNFRIAISGKEASAKCYLQAVHAGRDSHAGKTMTVWGEYSDRLQLRPEGWRIVDRALFVQHVEGDIGVALKGRWGFGVAGPATHSSSGWVSAAHFAAVSLPAASPGNVLALWRRESTLPGFRYTSVKARSSRSA
jgi:3-phenylpropionate/cinnamic acid dioxygenase small subunit